MTGLESLHFTLMCILPSYLLPQIIGNQQQTVSQSRYTQWITNLFPGPVSISLLFGRKRKLLIASSHELLHFILWCEGSRCGNGMESIPVVYFGFQFGSRWDWLWMIYMSSGVWPSFGVVVSGLLCWSEEWFIRLEFCFFTLNVERFYINVCNLP